MPSAGGRKRLEHKVALKESRSGTSIPVLIHGMWKGKRKGVLVATDEKLNIPRYRPCEADECRIHPQMHIANCLEAFPMTVETK
jgi:hypothetical protein